MSSSHIMDIASHWYAMNARDLPWRRPETTAWGVLVSEVMLQQTPVARVEPSWRSWISRWPTPSCLAREPAGEAIRAWGRLGYPRRALRLHTCATVIHSKHGGQVPSSLTDLLELPGIGTYTARAVATFAFRQRHPVVDTNVRRVIGRVIGGVESSGSATTKTDLATVNTLLPDDPEAAAIASIAIMELGALVCTSRNPKCEPCPLKPSCTWNKAGCPSAISSDGQRPCRSQKYAGTDRYVRGLLLAVLRNATDPVPATSLDCVWPDSQQRERALTGLLVDGLASQVGTDSYALPR